VDFIVGDLETGHATQLLQVCADVERWHREREVRALMDAMQVTGLCESTIVTMHDAEDIVADDGVIRVVPAWAWMLGVWIPSLDTLANDGGLRFGTMNSASSALVAQGIEHRFPKTASTVR